MTATKINRATAKECEQAIRKTFKAYIDGDGGPTLLEDFDDRPWTIIWEGGPYEWPFLLGGGVDEEVYSMMLEFVDEDTARKRATTPATDFPDGVMVEPINHYSVGLYVE